LLNNTLTVPLDAICSAKTLCGVDASGLYNNVFATARFDQAKVSLQSTLKQ
jgi:hypothetical protein